MQRSTWIMAAVGALGVLAAAVPANAQGWHGGAGGGWHGGGGGGWHGGGGNGWHGGGGYGWRGGVGVYLPPVYVGPPAYYPPPAYYSPPAYYAPPGVVFSAPGISVGIN
jgi:hypothetical protein